ncbi:MAG: undecaprenyl-phosphate alpha-N-acetylglucosaminyl 1-phosphate transferase [Gammaproteobacteria bacterium]|nr:MAG: undecaprenyl-phosphate alpha-N-acetylglucosaminyl 1-phosphate transferase [Gammaproteobacteria bacterium]RLA54973.1 MAG: undecaprenyl-phosphate alpha-N-acetylglucosaminyl 1-phosphate transferase [Gammaproteobacteria bacterium]
MFVTIALPVTFLMSVITIYLFTPVAVKVGLVDKPGGHKEHEDHVPLVGGLAIYSGVLMAWFLLPWLGGGTMNSIFLAAGVLLFTIGLADDRFDLSVKLRFGVQIVAALMLVYSNVVLADLGYIQSGKLFTLGIFAIPVTVFATLSAINAMNMMDGIDGLAGLVSIAILAPILVVSYVSANLIHILLVLCLMGAVGGFLLFNLHWKGRSTAHIFMGDAGSTLLGFLFATLLISLAQGEHRAMPPVTALWLFAIPLMDSAGVMLRRALHRRSPFTADRGHLHHLLLDAGFSVHQVVLFIALLQLALGAVGLVGCYLHISESISFVSFLVVLSAYIYLVIRPWRVVPMMRALHQKFSKV